MLNETSRSYPHAVLRLNSTDFINGEFNVNCEAILQEDATYLLKFSVDNTCNDLVELINSGKAEYLLRIVCRATFYRDAFVFSDNKFETTVKLQDLLHNVIVTPLIVAKEFIPNYYGPSFNQDYEGLEISVDEGDILGVAPTIKFNAEPNKEIGIEPNSIIHFKELPASNDEGLSLFKVDTTGHYIDILLPHNIIEYLREIRYNEGDWHGKKSFIYSIYVIPALVQVLKESFNETEYDNCKENKNCLEWFDVINKRLLEHEDINEDDDGYINFQNSIPIANNPVEFAEWLIDKPIIDSTKEIYYLDRKSVV